jgi:phosphoribosylformimino-5-aminoimidazole carboxamide ribotide isomerase
MQSVQFYIDAGVNYVIIGTQAVKEPEFVREACLAYPGQIIVGVDAINGKVATDGWTDVSAVNAIELAQKCAGFGVAAIIYTDISRDGMMKGVNVEATVELAEKSSIPVIASGGIAKLADIVDLKAAANITTGAGIIGAITGRALYEGELDLKEAQAYCDGPYG